MLVYFDIRLIIVSKQCNSHNNHFTKIKKINFNKIRCLIFLKEFDIR